MKETWKDIKGFEGLYQVSNMGSIKSFRKPQKYGSPDEFFLKPSVANNGYVQVTLYSKNLRKKFLVHRLVAEAFIPNPNNYPQINHKDENPLNNSADNLEWCTAKYNNEYGTAKYRQSITKAGKAKRVLQRLPDGTFLALYASPKVAEMITGIPARMISECCRGGTKTCKGFCWEYDIQ